MNQLLNAIWKTYLEIAPYLFIGLAFAGLLHLVFRRDFIARHLGKNNLWSVIKAAILGVPMPLCSCGVIPTALHLRREKASEGATLSFLISTPQTGVDSILATYGMMGPVFAIFRPIAAFITGVVGGVVANLFHRDAPQPIPQHKAHDCTSCAAPAPASAPLGRKLLNASRYAFVEFLDDIAGHLAVGIVLAGIISFAIPDAFFARYGGNGITGMLIMILFGLPLYVCATGSIPIAVSLMMKGISPGAAFVFLVVGPATNAATITLIGNVMGKRTVAIYLSVIAVFALLGGFALNGIYDVLDVDMVHEHLHSSSTSSPVMLVLTALFSIAFILAIYRRIKGRFFASSQPLQEVEMKTNVTTYSIEGMTCNHCVMHATKAIREVPGVQDVSVSLAEKKAVVSGEHDSHKIKQAVKAAGYSVAD
jgi:hypothetical protein